MKFGSITTGIVSDGLIFNMDAGNRASYIESSTTSYNTIDLTLTGSLINDTSGSLGSPKAWDFDGVDSYIDCGDHNIFSFGDGSNDSPFSLNVWINWDAIGSWKSLISKDGGGSTREWALLTDDSSQIRIFLKNAGGANQQSIDTDSTFSTGTWYNISTTYSGVGGNDATDGLKIYINGIVAATTVSADQAYTAMSNTTSPLDIGRYASSNAQCTNGKISNCQIYNRELSASEVLHNYNALKGRFT